MKINVKSLQGDEYNVDVREDQLVNDLKVAISEKANGMPVNRLKLVYKGRTMQDMNLVSEYNLEDGCRVHLIIQKDTTLSSTPPASSSHLFNPTQPDANNSITPKNCPIASTLDQLSPNSNRSATLSDDLKSGQSCKPKSKFEIILRERLGKHFEADVVERIMVNLEREINADINSSSLDDLERLAKQKLNISNE